MEQHSNTRSAEARGATAGAEGTIPDHVFAVINALADIAMDHEVIDEGVHDAIDSALYGIIDSIGEFLIKHGPEPIAEYARLDPDAAAFEYVADRTDRYNQSIHQIKKGE